MIHTLTLVFQVLQPLRTHERTFVISAHRFHVCQASSMDAVSQHSRLTVSQNRDTPIFNDPTACYTVRRATHCCRSYHDNLVASARYSAQRIQRISRGRSGDLPVCSACVRSVVEKCFERRGALLVCYCCSEQELKAAGGDVGFVYAISNCTCVVSYKRPSVTGQRLESRLVNGYP